jgi:hypothetical protein
MLGYQEIAAGFSNNPFVLSNMSRNKIAIF